MYAVIYLVLWLYELGGETCAVQSLFLVVLSVVQVSMRHGGWAGQRCLLSRTSGVGHWLPRGCGRGSNVLANEITGLRRQDTKGSTDSTY